MIRNYPLSKQLAAACFACLLPLQTFAEAPVVDQSENYAMLDEQEAAKEQPLVKNKEAVAYNDEEVPLVQDTGETLAEEASTAAKLKDLQQEIRELRGQLEVQAHDLSVLKEQQLAFYKDIDARLHNAPGKTAKAAMPLTIDAAPEIKLEKTASATPLPTAHANPADEQISYLAAYDLVKDRQFDEALTAMEAFTNKYPKGGYTANAHYWIGELYMIKKNYNEAISHFDIVLKQFPTSSKAAACTLKIGYALAASGKKAEAKKRLSQVLKNYPDTPTAQLAATRLQSLNAS